jgi:hypothetical protein
MDAFDTVRLYVQLSANIFLTEPLPAEAFLPFDQSRSRRNLFKRSVMDERDSKRARIGGWRIAAYLFRFVCVCDMFASFFIPS